MAFKSIQGSAKQSLLDYFVSGKAVQYHSAEFGYKYAAPQGLTATGGIISDYVVGSDVYRAHIFTSLGTFDVTAPGSFGDTVEYLVVAGGGGAASGGGGAGGYRTNVPTSLAPPYHNTTSAFPVSVATYPVSVGGGGAAVASSSAGATNGVDSSFGPPSEPQRIISKGGGAGGYINANSAQAGGSGGGAGRASVGTYPGGATQAITGLPVSPTQQGFPGGTNDSNVNYNGAGGGGAGDYGGNASPGNSSTGVGGVGLRNAIAGPNYPIGTPGPGPTTGGWFAGGGGTGGDGGSSPAAPGGAGGGGNGSYNSVGSPGTYATGGGGGGGGNALGGNGGSGIVVVRYQIGIVQTGTAKATGGAISYYNGMTIHTFTNSGDFTVTDASPVPISYVAIAGGGSGAGGPGAGSQAGGGGGAGGVVTNIPGLMPTTQSSVSIAPGSPNKITITIGAGAIGSQPDGRGLQGTSTTLSCSPAPLSITCTGGGFGGISSPGASSPVENGGPGGSGGGGAEGTGSAGPGSQGFNGGTGSGTAGSTENSGGGGGGAGGTGGNAPGNANGGVGGIGIQLPPQFRDPKSTVGYPGPNSQGYWLGGGGGGGTTTPGPSGGVGGKGGGAGGPYAGGGDGGTEPGPSGGSYGAANSGGGGGSAENRGYGGGSGIVLIAYPS